jgi:Tfp pilus assembly protein PilV
MRLRPRREDGGFTLVEAAVALFMFAVVLAGTGAVVVRALAGTGSTTRSVAATLLAGEALEQARTVSAQQAADGSTAVTTGRTAAAVGAVDVADLHLTDTQIAYGIAAPGGPTVPVRSTQTVDGTSYTVRVVIGTCTRDAAGGACDLSAGHVSPTTLYRVVAAVTWPGCRSVECPVTASTLLDPAPDAAFNALQDVLPVAHDKCWSTDAGSALTFDPTYKSYALRDTGDLGATPVQIVTAPGQGTLTQSTGSATWRYTPGAGSYTAQFTYRLVDRYHRFSDPAVITLQVGTGTC